MLKALTRIFTTRICPTCSKAVHRSKFATHQRRHSAGQQQYARYKVLTGQGFNLYWVEILFRRGRDGVWAIVPTAATKNLPTDSSLMVMAERELARMNGIGDAPVFTQRAVPGAELTPAPMSIGDASVPMKVAVEVPESSLRVGHGGGPTPVSNTLL